MQFRVVKIKEGLYRIKIYEPTKTLTGNTVNALTRTMTVTLKRLIQRKDSVDNNITNLSNQIDALETRSDNIQLYIGEINKINK